MCGIAGVFKFRDLVTVEDVSAVLRMLDAQVHRGPDDWGLLVPSTAAREPQILALLKRLDPAHVSTYPATPSAPAVVLGARRLSIIDRSPRGRMPMGTNDARQWIAFNGEIYNFRDLRAELRGSAAFRSNTDSEALLRGWHAWGDAVVERLRGMFAFALFEAMPHPRLFLGRDRFGIKPLYLSDTGSRVVFASEMRAVLRSGLVPSETNPEALRRFLELGNVPAPLTTMKDVRPLPVGHVAQLDASGFRTTRYWDLDHAVEAARQTPPPSRAEAVSSTRTLLEESVRLHLVSDVPLGAFLSGGIDSAAIVALTSRELRQPLTTVTLTFDETDASEADYARLVARRYGTDHREVRLNASAVFDELPRVFATMDQPTVDGLNIWCVSRAAREAGLRVVLSGLGGDEVFWGYRHVRFAGALAEICRLLSSLPTGARHRLARLAAAGGSLLPLGLDRAAYLGTPTMANAYLFIRGLFNPGQVRRLLGLSPEEPDTAPFAPTQKTHDGMREALTRLDISHYLGHQLLRDGDVMSMAHSVEMRVPYLDHRLVEEVLSLPARFKLDPQRPKPLLLDALDGRIPRAVWNRPKMGFTFPMARWMRQREPELRAATLESKLLNSRAVERVWDGFCSGRDEWSRPWALYVLSQFEAGVHGLATPSAR
jgi:asparagine synthase (glutamine-hydrolysing)